MLGKRCFSSVVPEQARVVVVGGGVIGNSVAYHLAKQGWSDVVLLERDKITSGTTWHAAGLVVSFGSTSGTSTDFRKYTKKLYSELEAETGQSTGFMPVGFIELATSKDRLEEYRRVADFNRLCGVEVHELGPSEVRDMFPLCRVDDVEAGFYVADDGRANPVDVTMALSKGARMRGAQIIEGVEVTGITKDRLGQVSGVTTKGGDAIKCEYVVNCAGMWARQFGELCGVNIPNQAAEHYYLITEAMSEVDPSWPVIEDPSNYTYIRPEGGGLMVGLFESQAAAWNVDKIPSDFSFGEIDPDWERMAPFVEAAMSRVPLSAEAGVKKFFCGPESFTPDLAPLIGEAPEVKNYFVAAGLNSIGILTGGGVGRCVANWIVNGKPDVDVTGINIDRMHKYQSNPLYRGHRVVESLGMVYNCHYPSYSMKTCRGAKKSAIYERLKAAGGYFRDVSGWECADWFAPPGVPAEQSELSWGRMNWFPYWEKEHRAARENVILMDMSFMSKFLVQGRDAGAYLNYLCTANVNAAVDMITYTQWLNDDGKLEGDVTVVKMSEEEFVVVVTDTMHRHAEAWLRRHIGDRFVTVADVTSSYAQLNIQGPRSRDLMQALTTADMSNEAFPFRTSREIDIGFARARCNRITYLGELGYELLLPAEQALHAFDFIVDEGKNFDLTLAGLKALASLRMEKGYRDYGHDMDNLDTILECGLGFTCDYEKPGGFKGKEAVLKQKAEKTLDRRLCQVLLKDPQPLMFHAEVVFRDGVAMGDVRAASYGHSLGGAVGLTMIEPGRPVTKKFLTSGTWEVSVAGKRYPCEVSLQPMLDSKNLKIKA